MFFLYTFKIQTSSGFLCEKHRFCCAFWTGLIPGIPQGSILGPSSIYIHTDDIELVLSLLVDLPAPCSHPTH